jgi:hypothetical protein
MVDWQLYASSHPNTSNTTTNTPSHSTKTLAFLILPTALPRLIAYYRSYTSPPKQAAALKPLSLRTSPVLTILFLSALLAFLSTLPAFSPENVFLLTCSRLETSATVLMVRLKALRELTAEDERLLEVLKAGGEKAALFYARFGPRVLREAVWVQVKDQGAAQEYLMFAATGMLKPHLLHLVALGVATSATFCGREGAQWRTVAVVAGGMIAAAELSYVATYDDNTNRQATRLADINFIFWKIPLVRGLAIAALDGVLGLIIYLQATGRAFQSPPPIGERLAEHARMLEGTLARMRGLGVVRNGAVRDQQARERVGEYWRKEEEVMRDVFEDGEVVAAQRAALERLNVGRVQREAGGFVDGVFDGMGLQQGGRLPA